MLGIRLYNTFNKAKDFFVKPTIYFSFGRWRNNHLLPIWRRGPILKLGKSPYAANTNCYIVKDRVQILTGYSTWKDSSGKEHKIAHYDWTKPHTLPGGLKSGDIVWNRDIRKKLKKWHLSWIKPRYQLPIWLSFHIFNRDVGWKTKWDETRYEWPPQFTIVFFGLAFSVWLSAPEADVKNLSQDGYWEGVIDYGFYKNKENFDPVRFIKGQGFMHWTEYTPIEQDARSNIYDKYKDDKGHLPLYVSDEYKEMQEELKKYPGKQYAALCIRECYINKDNVEIYNRAFSEVKAKYLDYEWIR